jgi:phosphoribosyl-ATP pyrophosphohydrolase/phosphoribosyl-AMP cyclohydrolase
MDVPPGTPDAPSPLQSLQSLPLLNFDANGLVPVIVQDHLTGEIRMFAYANVAALRHTIETGRATFWSRSRGELWEKGLTSGNVIRVLRVLVDCDGDCVVYSSEPHGNSCHTGAQSCFFRELDAPVSLSVGPSDASSEAPAWIACRSEQALLPTLEAVLEARKASTAKASYTKSLYESGSPGIGKKIREEAGELAAAIDGETDERVVSEAADTLYHLMVGLRWRGVGVRRVLAELARRFGQSGHAEKASR